MVAASRAILLLLPFLSSGCANSLDSLTPEQRWGISSFSAQLVADGLEAWFEYCDPQEICITSQEARASISLALTGIRVLLANVQQGMRERTGLERIEYAEAALERLGQIEKELIAITPDAVIDRALAAPNRGMESRGILR